MPNEALPTRALSTFFLTLLLLLPGIGAGYWGRDEAEYAGVAHGMNATGDYLVPRLFGRLYPDKPPLSEWLTAASFRILGEREASGRLPHVLLASGSIVLLLLFGARLLDLRRAAIASLLFSTSLLFIVYGRLLLTDSDLLFFTLASLFGLLLLLEGKVYWWTIPATGGALGLAILAKGPIALLVPGLFCAGYLAGGGVRTLRSPLRLALVLAVALAVALPWFSVVSRMTAGESLREFLLRENLHRFLHSTAGHRGPFFYFLPVLWLGFFPWSGLLLFLFRHDALRRSPARWGLLSCAGGSLVFFSLAATKLPHYLIPAMPAVALLVADAAAPAGGRERRIASWGTAVTGALLFGAAVVAGSVTAEAGGLRLLIPFGAAGLLSLCVPLFASREGGGPLAVAVALLASGVIAWGAIPALDRLRSTNRLGLAAAELRLVGEPLGGLQIHEAALTYYAGAARAEVWRTGENVARAVASSPTRSALVWLDSAETASLARERRLSVRILAEGPSLADPRVRGLLELCRIRASGARRR